MACAGAGQTPSDAPPVSFTDGAAKDRDRVAAINGLTDVDEAAREDLKTIAWRRSESAMLRVAAIDALARHDPDATGPTLALLLPTETDWVVIGRICELAVEAGWSQMTPSLVRSWSRPTRSPVDADRPERAALLSLHPDESDIEIVFSVFAEEDGDSLFSEKERGAAWALLVRLSNGDTSSLVFLLAGLDATKQRDDIAALTKGAQLLAVVPDTAEQLQSLTLLFDGSHEALLRASAAAIGRLTESQRRGLVLRHIAIVYWTSIHHAEWLDAPPDVLFELARARLHGRPRHSRNVGPGGGGSFAMDRLRDWSDDLVWGDLLSILVADELLQQPMMVASLFAQADRDKQDTSTEHGGAIVAAWNETTSGTSDAKALRYLPRAAQRTRDTEFVASTALLEEWPDALFHYHLHAQRFRNRDYAGPSEGDILYANRFGRHCLVFTFAGSDELAVDYYQPGGAKVDMGVLHRPAVQSASNNSD